MATKRLERDIRALLVQHEKGVVCSDLNAFRARLPSSGHNLRQVEHTLRQMRNRGVIRLKRTEGGTRVRLVPIR